MSAEVIVRGGLPGKIRIEVGEQFIEVDSHLSAYSALQEVCPWLADVLGLPVALIAKEAEPVAETLAPVVADVPPPPPPEPAKMPSLRPTKTLPPKGAA